MPATVDTYAAELDAITIFRGVDMAVVTEALKECEVRSLPAGTILMEPGQANELCLWCGQGRGRDLPSGSPQPFVPVQRDCPDDQTGVR